jgi:transmembrane sensor
MTLRPSERTVREAESFVARKMAGPFTREDEAALEAWLENPLHLEAFEEVRRSAALTDGFEEELLAENFEAELYEEAARADTERSRLFTRRSAGFGAAAAGIAAMLAVFVSTAPATLSYATQAGETRTVGLADGSAMTLGTQSEVEVALGHGRRRVDLIGGEAFFDVEKDVDRPFIVATDHGEITVTGTSFNVKLRPGSAALSVVSGAVEATHQNGDAEILLAGEGITFTQENGLTEKYPFDASMELAWRAGRARFEDTPLAEVVWEVNRYRKTPIVLADEVDPGATVTGEFTELTGETAPRALAAALGLQLVRREAAFELRPAEENGKD